MADYVLIKNYSRNGKMAISRDALQSITERAVASIPGANIATRKKAGLPGFFMEKPVKIILRSNGIADIRLEVALSPDAKVMDVCTKIQQEVAQAIQMTCETVPVSVNIKVVKVG
ncbi:MAG: Asp23/Gls24 family envelope stress response protein [Bacilli bacterium]|nr:Asp23/Gls24 family envelope stress response protein [Bacilli bacterium]